MSESSVSELVAAWFAGHGGAGIPDTLYGKWYDAVTEEPEVAWKAILEVLQQDLTEDARALLAAGPMEDLLCYHGAAFIDRVEEEARRNPRFNHLLGGVWRQEMPEEIWSRIEKARKETW
jgi:hypothetical protein